MQKRKQPWAAKNLGVYAATVYPGEKTEPQTLSVFSHTIACLQEVAEARGFDSASHLLEEVGRGEVLVSIPDEQEPTAKRTSQSFRLTQEAKNGLRSLARKKKRSISSLVRAIACGAKLQPKQEGEILKGDKSLTVYLSAEEVSGLRAIAQSLGLEPRQLLEAIGTGTIEAIVEPAATTPLVTTSVSITRWAKTGLRSLADQNKTSVSAIVRAIADFPDYILAPGTTDIQRETQKVLR